MIHPLTFLKGAGLGAGIMYFFDPISGNRRRALVRDQLVHSCNITERQAGKVYRDASNRLEGAKHELGAMMQSSDQGFVGRVQEGAMGVGRTLGVQGENWSPTAKAAMALAGAGLVTSLLNKSDIAVLALGALGLSYAAKELADQEAMRSRGQRQQRGSHQGLKESQGDQRSGQRANTQNTGQRGQEDGSKAHNEGSGMESSVPTEKAVVHNL